MTRKFVAIGLVLTVAIIGIVRAQERPSSFPALQPPAGPASSRFSPETGRGASEPSRFSVRELGSDEVREGDVGEDAIRQVAGEQGLQSVLKRNPGTTVNGASPPVTERSDVNDIGSEADPSSTSRRTPTRTMIGDTSPPATETPRPSYTTRAGENVPSRGTPTARAVGSANALELRGQTPSVRVEAVGPRAVTVGKSASYKIIATNEGTAMARDVDVEIGMPAGVSFDSVTATSGDAQPSGLGGNGLRWKVPSLPGGARAELTIQITPRDDRPIQLSIDWSLRATSLTAAIDVQKPALQVQITGPEDILYGARQIYTITISNPGTGPAENVSLDVSTGGNGQARRIGTIAPGAQEQIRLELVAREAGPLEIKAAASGDGVRHEAVRAVLVRRAELAVGITGPGLKFAGSTGTYEVRVENVGNAVATDVEVSVRLPAGARYVSGVEGAVDTAGRVTWKLKELAPRNQRQFAVEVIYDKAGALQCEVHAAAGGELASTALCQTTVEAIADLKLVVNDPQGPKAVGEDVVYELKIINRGSKAAHGVEAVGQFSDGVEPIRVEGGEAQLVPGQAIFKPLATVEAGQTIVLKIIARADKAGNHRFRAVLKCADPDTELVAEDMTRFFGDDLRTASQRGTASR